MSKQRLFIHIPKNGGMTIRHSAKLKALTFPATKNHHKAGHAANVLAKMKSTGDEAGYEHARWRDIKPAVTSQHRSFAILRNPWDRVVSRYFFAKKVIEVEKKVDPSYADVSSFEAFLEERHKWGTEPYMWHRAVRGWYPALDHVTDEGGSIKCDILRFEDYNNEVCKYFGLDEMTRARNVTALNKGSYQDLYTPETIQIIGDWYQKDIEAFGFDFDTGATKNYYFEG